MPVVSPTGGFIDALRYGSTLVTARLTLYEKGSPSGEVFIAPLSTGTITADRNSEQRRSGEVTLVATPTIPPPSLLPVNPGSDLAPFGNEVYLELGITANGDLANISWVPLGLFVIATSTVDDTTINTTVTLNLYDRSWTIAQRTLKQPYNFPATPSGNFAAEIEALLDQVWSQEAGVAPLVYAIAPTSLTVPSASYNQGSDPWQACLDMAAAIGYELYFDVHGTVVGKPIPNPAQQAPVWYFTDTESDILGLGGTGSAALFGDAYSTPVEISVAMTRDGIYNDIIIQGTGTANAATYSGTGLQTASPPALAEAADTNPQSPTYIAGGMGDVPNFVSSSLIATAGAQAMAAADLEVALSSAWEVTITAPPNPIFDIDDVVSITRPRVGLNGALMVIDLITTSVTYDDVTQLTGRVISAPPVVVATPTPPPPTPPPPRAMGDGTPTGWQSWVANNLAAPSIWAYGPAWTAADLAALAAAWPSTVVLALDNTGASPTTCQVLDVESVDVSSASVAESWIEDRLADVGPYMISRPTLYMNVDGSYYLGQPDDIITPIYNAGLYLGVHYDLWLAKTGGGVPSAPIMTAAGPAHASVASVATQYADYSDTGFDYDLDVVFDASWYPTGA